MYKLALPDSTANRWGALPNSCNLGLTAPAGESLDAAKYFLGIPLRHKAHRNIGGGVSDEANLATFDSTIPRIEKLSNKAGIRARRERGEQYSTTVETTQKGRVTIKGLTLPNPINHTGLATTQVSSWRCRELRSMDLLPLCSGNMTLTSLPAKPVAEVFGSETTPLLKS